MKASKLIKELEKAIKEHGDLDVQASGDFQSSVNGVYLKGKNINSHYDERLFMISTVGY